MIFVQQDLFHASVPEGFEYRSDFLTAEEERDLLDAFAGISFSHVEMRGVVARRKTAHFGYDYAYEGRTAAPGHPIPEFLLPFRDRIAAWAGTDPGLFAEVLITDYPRGAPIGWHRDAPMFGDVAGISLGTACRMKFRPYISPSDVRTRHTVGGEPRRTTHEIELAERSAYLIRGVARREFEHSIPPVAGRRFSVTFRTLARLGRQRR